MDQALGAFQDAVEDALGRGHLPQDVHVDAALAVGDLVRDPGLGDAAGNRVADQLLVPLAPRLATIDLVDDVAVVIEAVGVHAGKCADPTSRCPGAGTFAVGHGDAFAAFDQRQDLTTRDQQRLERLQRTPPKTASLRFRDTISHAPVSTGGGDTLSSGPPYMKKLRHRRVGGE